MLTSKDEFHSSFRENESHLLLVLMQNNKFIKREQKTDLGGTSMDKSIAILHVFLDDKFFDRASAFFDSLKSVKNLYHFYSKSGNFNFSYIKDTHKIREFSSYKEYVSYFSDPRIDVIYFHSLNPLFYKLFKHIDAEKTIIWWCWGFEIYLRMGILPPLVNINLYKPLTQKEFQKQSKTLKSIVRFVYYALRFPRMVFLQKKVLQRIDFFSPVLPIEYRLMQGNKYFKAKPFLFGGPTLGEHLPFSKLSSPQNILIGNSLTYTNNHLDIFFKIRTFQLGAQKYVIPVNYGNAYGGKENLMKMANLSDDKSIWLDVFLPREEYKSLFDSISHAIFGHVRQQALGNIYLCLHRSIKVFLYKDSLIYKQLKEWGFIVYTIDDDLTEDSLQMVLPEEYAFKNYSLVCKLINGQERKCRAEQELNLILG